MSLRDDIQNELDAWALNPALNPRGPTAFFDAEFVGADVHICGGRPIAIGDAPEPGELWAVLLFARGDERVSVAYPVTVNKEEAAPLETERPYIAEYYQKRGDHV